MADKKSTLKQLRLAVIKGSASKVAQHLRGLNLREDQDIISAPSLLAEALTKSHVSIAATLLEAGARPAAGEGAALLVSALKADGAHLVEPIVAALGDEAATQVGAMVREWTPLMHAAKVGQQGPIEVLINAKADVDAKMARHGGTALMVAAQNTQLTAARCLLAAKANVEIADEQGWRALQWAAQIGPVEMIQFLLESGATVDAKNDVAGVSSAMMVAVENGHLAAADALLTAKANPEATDAQGWTALTIASAAGHTKLLARLLEAGASVTARTQTSGRTAIMAAAQGGHVAALSLLLASPECDTSLRDATDGNGTTAIMLAAKNGHSDALSALLAAGCAPFAVDSAGVSALELACRRGAQPAVSALLRANAAPAMQVARGVMLASKQGHAPVVTMLMAAGAPVQHILIRAASVGDSEQLLVLLKAGAAADTEVASEAMLSACCSGHRGIVQLLLNARASVFKQDRSHGRNALHLASLHGHASVVQTLLKAGAAINAVDPGGRSALQIAIDSSKIDCVEELLRAGAALERRGVDWDALLAQATDETVRSRLVAEHSRRQLEGELMSATQVEDSGKQSKKQRKKQAARAAAAESKAAAAEAEAAIAAAAEEDDDDDAEEEAVENADVNVKEPPSAAAKEEVVPASPVVSPVAVKKAEAAPVEVSEAAAATEAARDLETFGQGQGGGGGGVKAVEPPFVPPAGWLPPSDLIAAGGRVVANTLDMESLARQAAAFRRVGQQPGSPGADGGESLPTSPQPLAAAMAAAAVAGGGEGGTPTETVAELMAKVEMLQLRVAAEQQCVLREQHITARMWIEKTQAEERTEAALKSVADLEQTVAAWEAWHQSQRRQQRQRRQHALRSTTPEAMLRALLAEWGVTSVQALKLEERQKLASGLAAAVSALISGKSPPPPGLAAAAARPAEGA